MFCDARRNIRHPQGTKPFKQVTVNKGAGGIDGGNFMITSMLTADVKD